jgi:uncharacterized protein YndB with AHSA1/START domain
MWIFKAFFLVLALALLAFGGLSLYGLSLPEAHKESVSVDLKAGVPQVWELITGYEDQPGWWAMVKEVKLGKGSRGEAVTWNTDEHGQRVGFITLEQKRLKKLVRQVYDPRGELGWGGTWTYTLEKVGKGKKAFTRLTIQEDGHMANPFYRVLAAKVFGYKKNLASFAAALDAEIKRQAK